MADIWQAQPPPPKPTLKPSLSTPNPQTPTLGRIHVPMAPSAALQVAARAERFDAGSGSLYRFGGTGMDPVGITWGFVQPLL